MRQLHCPRCLLADEVPEDEIEPLYCLCGWSGLPSEMLTELEADQIRDRDEGLDAS